MQKAMNGKQINRHKNNSSECGWVFIQETPSRVARYTDSDPWYEVQKQEYVCNREYGHGGDHISSQSYEIVSWEKYGDIDPRTQT